MTWAAMLDAERTRKWRVERARAGHGWLTISPDGHGMLWSTWQIAMTVATESARWDNA